MAISAENSSEITKKQKKIWIKKKNTSRKLKLLRSSCSEEVLTQTPKAEREKSNIFTTLKKL